MTRRAAPAWKSWGTPPIGGNLDEWQAGRCAWCGTDRAPRMVRDHCHMTGLVRGLLCSGCNTKEGVSENPAWESWRNGDHPAAAMRYAEVYTSAWGGGTAISPRSALAYYDGHERAAWFELAPAAIRSGDIPWPADAPWLETAAARQEDDQARLRKALEMPWLAAALNP